MASSRLGTVVATLLVHKDVHIVTHMERKKNSETFALLGHGELVVVVRGC